jgi:tetratricopeptide (TPR) repeat protein
VLIAAAIILAAWVAYSNSFQAPFLLDNEAIVLRDQRVHAFTPVQFHRILAGEYWETKPNGLYRPLTTISYLFNYAVLGNGPNPEGYHQLNFLLHAVNIALVYALSLLLFRRTAPAALAAALWAVHPVLTESVTNIVGRADLLAAFGVLAALLIHTRALGSAGGRKAVWLVAMALAVAVGMFSKESAIVIVAVLAAYDFTFARDASWRSRLPSYLAAAVPCLVYLYIRAQVLANSPYMPTQFGDNPLLGAGFWSSRFTAWKVIGRYFLLLLWPARLSYDYSYNEIPLSGWADWKAWAALLVSLAIIAAAARNWRRQPVLFFCAGFFFITLSPTSNLAIRIGAIMAERFLYLPAVAVAVGAVAVAELWWKRYPKNAAAAAAAIVLLLFAGRTHARNQDWAEGRRFWLSGVEAAPGSYKTHLNAATAIAPSNAEDWSRAVREADQALSILDPLPDGRNAGNAYRDAGALYRSVGDAKTVAPADPVYWYRKSLAALLRSERIELSWDNQYRQENARRGKPGLTSLPGSLYLELGRTYLRLGDRQHAREALERGHAVDSNPDLLEELGSVYQADGDLRRAAQALVEALSMDPRRVQLASRLVELYGQIDRGGCAVVREGGQPALNVQCPMVHGDICSASRNVAANYLRHGQPYEADAIRRIATQDLGCAADLLK